MERLVAVSVAVVVVVVVVAVLVEAVTDEFKLLYSRTIPESYFITGCSHIKTFHPCYHITQMVKTLDTDDVKQKTSLFSVQRKICLVLFHSFSSFVLRHLCPVHEVSTHK